MTLKHYERKWKNNDNDTCYANKTLFFFFFLIQGIMDFTHGIAKISEASIRRSGQGFNIE